LRETNFEDVLLLAEGYGVVEVYVREESDIACKTLGESQLRQRGMVVMAIDRVGQIIPAPQSDTTLLVDDRLICYGKVEAIRDIADEKVTGNTLIEAGT
jgi:ribosomal protein S6--L-glutamate ligase